MSGMCTDVNAKGDNTERELHVELELLAHVLADDALILVPVVPVHLLYARRQLSRQLVG